MPASMRIRIAAIVNFSLSPSESSHSVFSRGYQPVFQSIRVLLGGEKGGLGSSSSAPSMAQSVFTVNMDFQSDIAGADLS